MAALPPIRSLRLEDYQSQKAWIGPFLTVMNTFMTTVVSALTRNLTLIDNTTSDIKYIQLSSVPTSTAPASVSWSKMIIPVAVIIGNVKLSTGAATTLSTAVQVQWQMSQDNKSLQITNVVGITPTATTQYVLTLICIAG